jgi:hypothetical protein
MYKHICIHICIYKCIYMYIYDVGIAVSGSTDAARAAADIILTEVCTGGVVYVYIHIYMYI